MFALRQKLLSSGRGIAGSRGFCSIPLYVGNLNHDTTAEKLREVFGKYGHIGGVRLNIANDRDKYAHIYFTSGTPPLVNGQEYYMMTFHPTENETNSVNKSIEQAKIENRMTVVDGNTLYVSHTRSSDAVELRKHNSRSYIEALNSRSYKGGFHDGYRRGYADGMATVSKNKTST